MPGVLDSHLGKKDGRCVELVVMPDHVHAIIWFPEPDPISHFMKPWKQRRSIQIKRLIRSTLVRYADTIDPAEPVWQAGYDDFNLFSGRKAEEKLGYMHQNPVRAGFVEKTPDWRWSSTLNG